MNKKLLLFLVSLAIAKAEEAKGEDMQVKDAVLVGLGLVVLMAMGAIYAHQNCRNKTVVEFESFEASNPTPADIVSEGKGKELTTFSTEAIK